MSLPQRKTRLLKDINVLLRQKEFLVDQSNLDEGHLLENAFTVDFEAPEDSPFYPSLMKIQVSFPPRYPFEAPNVHFVTPVYHPNIDSSGKICLDLLKPLPSGSWKPSIDILALFRAIRLLLTEANPDDPLMPDIAAEYRDSHEQYCANARRHAGLSALLSPVTGKENSPALKDENQIREMDHSKSQVDKSLTVHQNETMALADEIPQKRPKLGLLSTKTKKKLH